jgi:hypothetical protein
VKAKHTFLAGLALAAAAVGSAQATTTVSFAGVAPQTLGSVTVDGYTFTGAPGTDSFVWPGPNPNGDGANNLILCCSPAESIDITKAGGGAFTLESFQMAISWYSPQTTDTVDVNGTPLTITNTFTTYDVGVTGTSVAISGLASDDGYWTADNFVFGSVPEPATWTMMILGLAGLGGVLRAQRRAHQRLEDLAAS